MAKSLFTLVVAAAALVSTPAVHARGGWAVRAPVHVVDAVQTAAAGAAATLTVGSAAGAAVTLTVSAAAAASTGAAGAPAAAATDAPGVPQVHGADGSVVAEPAPAATGLAGVAASLRFDATANDAGFFGPSAASTGKSGPISIPVAVSRVGESTSGTPKLAQPGSTTGAPAVAQAPAAVGPTRAVPGRLSNRASAAQRLVAGSMSLTLTGQIQLGTPAQTLTAQFDTGSSNFWIRSSLCSDGNGCSGGPSFNIPRSTSFIAGPADQDPTSLGYGDGTAVICTYNQDVLAIAGVGVANSTLCAANAILLPPNVPNVDGLIGMGPPDRAANSTTDFDAYLRAAFTTPGVSFWFDRKATEDATGKSARAGEVTFGGANAARMSPAGFRFFPIVRDLGMWVLQLDSVTINGRNFIPTGLSKHAIIDTGSTLIILAPAIFKEVNSFMGGVESGGLYVVDCEKARTFPPVSFVFGATPFTLTWDKQIFSDGTTCVSVFAPNQDDDSVLGVAFLRHFYTTFDYGSGADGAFRVGIAQLAASDVFQSPLGNSTTGTKPTVSIPKVAPVVGPKPVAPPKVNVTRNADGGLTLNTNKKPTVTTTAVRPTVTPPKNGAAAASVMSFSALAALAASAIFVSAAF